MARAGFHDRKTERCPDCEIEGRLTILGTPAWNAQYGFRLTYGCENCDGRGDVPREKHRDPYDTGQGAYRFQESR